MRGIAKTICRALWAVGFWRLLLRAERTIGWRRHAVVLLYHHIRADDDVTTPLSLVEEGVSESVLNTQLAAFRRWYQASTSGELASALSGDQKLSDDSLVVTFDDGYRDNRTLACPILRAHQLQGLIFVATGFIESDQRFWWVELNDVVRSLTPATLAAACAGSHGISVITQTEGAMDLGNPLTRRQLRICVAQRLTTLPTEQLRTQMAALVKASSRPTETSLPLLSWREMREMSAEDFEFGAHTVNHPYLTRLNRHELFREIEESAACLTRRLGRRPVTFAYPHGDVDDVVEQTVRAAHFTLAYAAHPGVTTPGRTNPFRIPRIQLAFSDPAVLEVVITAIKLSKYLPRLMRPVLSTFFGVPFET
jgi:peptidoglycan/xylan/chitin deacetylase (PgdA/CDA1 family)